MADIKKAFGTDPKKESGGVWVDCGDGARVRIRRFNYVPAQKYLQAKLKPHRKAIELDVFSDESMNAIFVSTLAKFLIVAWENFNYGKDADGKDIALTCTEANVIMVLKELTELRDMLLGYSRSVELYKLGEEEADAKN